MAIYYLEKVGFPPSVPLPREKIVEFCRQISAGEIRDVDVIADHLTRFWGYMTIVSDHNESNS